MPEIGATLREARMRARIDVSEIEATTKIRAKYLRALENEEWSLLPGPTFVKSFLRTYAQALGLDGKALVEEYRQSQERTGDPGEPIVPSTERRRSRGPSGGSSRGYTIAVVSILAVIVLLVVLLATNSGSKSGTSSSRHTSTGRHAGAGSTTGTSHATRSREVALSLRASSVVYVCLIGDGRKLIPGVELQPGSTTPTYHARRFDVTLGNSGVIMVIDGRPRTVPASSAAIGYSLTKTRGRHTLPSGSQPTCR